MPCISKKIAVTTGIYNVPQIWHEEGNNEGLKL